VTVGATLVASLLAVLERPATWPLGLVGFLIRGGFVLVLAPIIVLPTAIGLANVVAPILTSALLSGLTPTVVLLIAGVGLGGMAWLLGGGLLAAAADGEAIRRTIRDDEDEPAGGIDAAAVGRDGDAWRVLSVRLVAHLPLLVALAWGATRVVAAAYREFTVPVDTVTPLVLRVLRAVPDAILVIVLAWFVGEILGGLAARRVVQAGESPPRALRSALAHVARRPIRTLVQAVVPLVALVLVLVPSAAAAAAAWTAIRATLADGLPAPLTLGAVLLLVVVWGGQLILLGLVAAWRGAVWTIEVDGTFGGVGARREGDWYPSVMSGTVGDPSGTGPRTGSEEYP
jgi:hypothetical protein